jgi:hypothetical protein
VSTIRRALGGSAALPRAATACAGGTLAQVGSRAGAVVIDVRAATTAGTPGRPNEDAFAVSGGLVVVADGATAPPSLEYGCRHSPAWYAHRLVAEVVACHGEDPDAGPRTWLARAIARTAAAHGGGCDLGHQGTPSAAVALLAAAGDQVSWLVLGDCAVLLDRGGGTEVVTDQRVSQTSRDEWAAVLAGDVALGSAEHARRLAALVQAHRAYRNRDGGYWVAASDPAAAGHALTGSVPADQIRRAALLTDGAAWAADLYRTHTWDELLADLESQGPAAVLAQLRAFEATDPTGVRSPRTKPSDDATAVVVGWRRV